MAKRALVTKASSDFGGVSRLKNTKRVFVAANQIGQAAVTGTWALENASGVITLGTDDASTTNVFQIPLPAAFSDAEMQSGSGVTDRGVKVLGVELLYQVATSALGAFDLDIYSVVVDADGDPAATEVVTTLTPDTTGDDGTEVDDHRMAALIAENDRFFLDSGRVVYALAEIEDGTSSDVNIFGAIWHLEVTEE